MIKKSINAYKGIKVSKDFGETKKNYNKKHFTTDSVFQRQQCLNCTKPAKECKGDCFSK